jgi:hypothetical protein
VLAVTFSARAFAQSPAHTPVASAQSIGGPVTTRAELRGTWGTLVDEDFQWSLQ